MQNTLKSTKIHHRFDFGAGYNNDYGIGIGANAGLGNRFENYGFTNTSQNYYTPPNVFTTHKGNSLNTTEINETI